VCGTDRLKKISESLKLPYWWIEAVVIEYFPCRRFGEKGRLWTFDFNLLSDEMIETIPAKQVVIPNFYLVQNVRPQDFTVRAAYALTGYPTAPLDEADFVPEGIANNSAFAFVMQKVSAWDPKLFFSEVAVVRDESLFYQWKIAERTPHKEHGSWFKSELFDLEKLYEIYHKLTEYRTPGILDKPSRQTIANIKNYYETLEQIRDELRGKILEYHYSKKKDYDKSKHDVPEPPRLSLLDTVKLDKGKGGYQVKTQIDALFYRSAIQNLEKAFIARKEEKDPQKKHEALIDELEYSAMCIIASVTCLETYISFGFVETMTITSRFVIRCIL
jgi:hypothetical protein